MEDLEEMDDPRHDFNKKKDERKSIGDIEHEPLASDERGKAKEAVRDKTDLKDVKTKPKSVADLSGEKHDKVDMEKKELSGKKAVIDKELLGAFRFFDRKRTSYIMVEDMKLIIHNLGKFLFHTDVKERIELMQSALLESNIGRDDRILYNKLFRMNDI